MKMLIVLLSVLIFGIASAGEIKAPTRCRGKVYEHNDGEWWRHGGIHWAIFPDGNLCAYDLSNGMKEIVNPRVLKCIKMAFEIGKEYDNHLRPSVKECVK